MPVLQDIGPVRQGLQWILVPGCYTLVCKNLKNTSLVLHEKQSVVSPVIVVKAVWTVKVKALSNACRSMIVTAAPAREATFNSGVPNVSPRLSAPV